MRNSLLEDDFYQATRLQMTKRTDDTSLWPAISCGDMRPKAWAEVQRRNGVSRAQSNDPSLLYPVVHAVQLTASADEDAEYTEQSMLPNNDLETQLVKECMKGNPTKFHYDSDCELTSKPCSSASPEVSTDKGHKKHIWEVLIVDAHSQISSVSTPNPLRSS